MRIRFGGRLAAALAACALCASAAFAQTVLTIDSAVQMAFENNISIERSAITLRGLERAKSTLGTTFPRQ